MRVDDFYVDKDGNYLGQDGADTDDVRVIDKSLWTGVGIGGEDGANQKTELGTESLQLASTKLSEYEGGVGITDATWDAIEADGGEKMTPSVQNNSLGEALVLPEKFDKKTVVLESGEGYYPQADGVSTASSRANGKVHKIGDGSKVEVTSAGKVKHVNWAASRLVKSGTKGTSYLNSQAKDVKWDGHPTQQPNYNHWARLYGVPMKSPNTLVPTGSN